MSNPNPPDAPPLAPPVAAPPRKIARIRPTSDNPLLIRRPPRPSTNLRTTSSTTKPPTRFTASTPTPRPDPPPINEDDWTTFKLTTTKASLLAGLRHHVIRLHPKHYDQIPDPTNPSQTIGVPRKVDLLDPNEFKRPLRLHRRNPSAPLGGVRESEAARLLASQQEPVVDEEQEARIAEQQRKEAERAEIASKIGGEPKKKLRFGKKTEQVFKYDAANAKMRYEESQPWFIEDFDNTNTWQGQREQNMSNGTFVALVPVEDGGSFRMVPVEKWYKFREVNKFRLSAEEVAAERKRFEGSVPVWLKREVEGKAKEEEEQLTAAELALYNKNAKLRVKSVITSKGSEEVKISQDEEIDYKEDRFDNDDAGRIYDDRLGSDDEERKHIEARIKKEQYSSNAFDLRSEKEYEEEKTKQRKLAVVTKKYSKKTKKVLRKREGNYVYNSDSDSNPYASSEESEDEEELIRRAEAQKKELDAKLKANEEKQAAEAAKQAKKLADAAEKRLKAAEKRKETAVKKKSQKTSETSTPSPGLTAPSKKGGGKRSTSPPTTSNSDTEGRHNKRPGSPFDSESGEGKKPEAKKFRKGSKVNETMGDTPPMGPPPPKKAGTKRKVDENENEPGEKRDKKKKAKLETQGRAASTSPAPPPAAVITPTSPMAKVSIPQSTPAPVTDEEIRALLRSNPQGVSVKSITATFKGRMTKNKEDIQKMVASIKRVAKLGPEGLWVLKE